MGQGRHSKGRIDRGTHQWILFRPRVPSDGGQGKQAPGIERRLAVAVAAAVVVVAVVAVVAVVVVVAAAVVVVAAAVVVVAVVAVVAGALGIKSTRGSMHDCRGPILGRRIERIDQMGGQ